MTTGNEVDLEVADFIHHFAGRDSVAVIALYVEGFKDGEKLRIALDRAIRAGKPVVAIKMGATEAGARSAASHTGHLVGRDEVVDGLFRQYGVIRVGDVDELLETANLLSKLPLGAGSRCTMYTVSGGTAALMAEHADASGLSMPRHSPALCEAIHRYVPANLNVTNPVDNGGVFVMTRDQADRVAVLELLASNPDTDLVVVGLNSAHGPLSDGMASDVRAARCGLAKPIVAIWASILTDTPGYRDLVASGVPIMRSFGKCMRALASRQRYLERRATYERPDAAAGAAPATTGPGLGTGTILSATETAALLESAGIAMPRQRLVASPAEARAAAAALKGPVVLKLVMPDVPHKTDMGFVRLGIASPKDAEVVAAELLDTARALPGNPEVEGVLVQEQVPAGVELIVGLTLDAQFGPALTIGAGGVHAEVVRDVATMPLPVTERDVREMIAGLRIAPLLDGVRGAAPADRDALVDLVLAVARLGASAEARILEMDVNPVIALADRVVAVDALLVQANPRPAAQAE